MKTVLAFAAILFATAAAADDIDCHKAMTQSAMNICADRDFRAADAKLNAAYAKLMAALDDAGFKTKLKTAQRAWISFRDSECTFETADNEGGSIHPMVYSGCLTRLTKERIKALEQHLTCFNNAETCGM
jgi:uncharacterized protein YecT (DUF1311 family)